MPRITTAAVLPLTPCVHSQSVSLPREMFMRYFLPDAEAARRQLDALLMADEAATAARTRPSSPCNSSRRDVAAPAVDRRPMTAAAGADFRHHAHVARPGALSAGTQHITCDLRRLRLEIKRDELLEEARAAEAALLRHPTRSTIPLAAAERERHQLELINEHRRLTAIVDGEVRDTLRAQTASRESLKRRNLDQAKADAKTFRPRFASCWALERTASSSGIPPQSLRRAPTCSSQTTGGLLAFDASTSPAVQHAGYFAAEVSFMMRAEASERRAKFQEEAAEAATLAARFRCEMELMKRRRDVQREEHCARRQLHSFFSSEAMKLDHAELDACSRSSVSVASKLQEPIARVTAMDLCRAEGRRLDEQRRDISRQLWIGDAVRAEEAHRSAARQAKLRRMIDELTAATMGEATQWPHPVSAAAIENELVTRQLRDLLRFEEQR